LLHLEFNVTLIVTPARFDERMLQWRILQGRLLTLR